MKDKKALDEWMRKTISSNTEDLIRKSQDEINDIINMTINKIVTEQKIEKLINIGALRIEQIRLEESKETDLPSINKEYEKEINKCVGMYISEANERKKSFEEAKQTFNSEIAAQAKNGEYGNPDKFCCDVDATNWMSATVATSDDEIIRYIMNICKRDPRMGKVTTGGIVTVKDSTENWYLSWTINRQPQFKSQDKNMVLVWLYSLNTNKEGNYVKKAMRDCTGEEICREWLYHIGVPTEKINALAKNSCNTTTCYMPYINAFFQPRKESDRPKVVPDGAVNFAFIGQFAETPRDTIFTTEYSMRTGMESVYTLLDIDRGVPEVWGSKYDVRELLRACYYAIDKKPITDIKLSFKEKMLLKVVMKKAKGTDVELLLKESGLIE